VILIGKNREKLGIEDDKIHHREIGCEDVYWV
jgi:hypothetical protein